jgi:hypothetical protein
VSSLLASRAEPGILARLKAAQERERELLTPAELAGIFEPGQDVDQWWEDAPMTVRRTVAKFLLRPEWLGYLVIVPAVKGGRVSKPEQRIEFRTDWDPDSIPAPPKRPALTASQKAQKAQRSADKASASAKAGNRSDETADMKARLHPGKGVRARRSSLGLAGYRKPNNRVSSSMSSGVGAGAAATAGATSSSARSTVSADPCCAAICSAVGQRPDSSGPVCSALRPARVLRRVVVPCGSFLAVSAAGSGGLSRRVVAAHLRWLQGLRGYGGGHVARMGGRSGHSRFAARGVGRAAARSPLVVGPAASSVQADRPGI